MRLACLCFSICLFAAAKTAAQSSHTDAHFDDLARRASAALANDPKAAVDLCREALASNPSWAEGWFDLGAAYYTIGRYPESVSAFDRASELAPRKGAVWAFRGLGEYQLDNKRKALADIQHAESLGLPDNPAFVSTVRTRAAFVLIKAKDFSAAIEQLRPLALLGDNSSTTLESFGVSALGLPVLPRDIPAEKKALVELAGQAEWAISAAHDADANKALHELLTAYANEPGVHYLKGIYLLSHDPEAARSEFEKELAISPAHVPARLQIAIIDIRTGHADQAARTALEAVRLEPGNALGHTVLARAYMLQNNSAKAVPELQAAAQLAPANPQIHLYLQQVYSRLGNTAGAAKEKAAFIRLHSAGQSVPSPEPTDVAR